jgi:hypothetical protein
MPTAPTFAMRWDRERLIVEAAGEMDPAWGLALVDRVGEAAATSPTRTVLVDASRLRATYTDLDRYNLGIQIGRRWRTIPYALVADPAMVDPRRFGEMVAQNRGANARVFTEHAEAAAWLDSQHLQGPA